MQWIFELPIDGLPAHVLNLRQILQASTGSSITKEFEGLAAAKAEIATKVPGFFSHPRVPEFTAQYAPDKLSQTIKSALGRWVRHTVASRLLCGRPGTEHYDLLRVGTARRQFILISLEQFQNIRSVLENLDEFPILADVIKICCNSIDMTVLTAASDTVNYHFEIFSAMGAVSDLFQALYSRYEDLHSQKLIEKSLTESLIDLDSRLSRSRQVGGYLHSNLLMYKQNSIVAARSPLSDYRGEAMHPSELAFIDRVEQSFTSGTLMETQILEQTFAKIMMRLQESWYSSVDKPARNLGALLMRLRNYGVSLFEKLMCQWLDEFLVSKARPKLRDCMPSLICAGVITLSTVLERTMMAYSAVEDGGPSAYLAIEAYELLTISDGKFKPVSNYVRISVEEDCIKLIIE